MYTYCLHFILAVPSLLQKARFMFKVLIAVVQRVKLSMRSSARVHIARSSY
jgi:hypothetical protein